MPGKLFWMITRIRVVYFVFCSETDRYFRGLVEYLSSEYKRKAASGEKQNFDFASMMMANEISEEKAERKVFK